MAPPLLRTKPPTDPLAITPSAGVANSGGLERTWIDPPRLSPATLTGVAPEKTFTESTLAGSA